MEKIVKFIPMEKKLSQKEMKSKVLYFDIETTGLSAGNSMIYMIGLGYFKEAGYEVVQFFADNAIDEARVILEFLEMIKDFDCLVTFNGEHFDMPFIQKRMKYLGISEMMDLLEQRESLDIYRIVRKYTKQLGMENGKQKTVEHFLGIYREDKFNGGELIEVYRTYLRTRQQELRDCLLLHNFEDIEGLFLITDILPYCDMLEGKWQFSNWKSTQEGITIWCELDTTLSNIWLHECDDGRVEVHGRQMKVDFYPKQMDLKLFYKDYKNYYYLPMEDVAIHRSVADFVDKEYRKKATKETCYAKHCVPVIRNYGAAGFHELKESYQSKEIYVNVNEITELLEQCMKQDEVALKRLQNFILGRI